MIARIGAALVLATLFIGPARAEGPSLALPVSCTVGETCWIANLVDLDAGPGVRDYACGTMSYDGHKGTDIAIRDRGVMAAGVPVLAAAAGRVLRVRDGTPDHDGSHAAIRAAAGRDCGNGIVVDHGGGWQTQYCHLRMGSLSVSPGTEVAQGAPLGAVGMSGRTAFPHLHLSLRRGDRVVDPFLGAAPGAAARCGPGDSPSWAPAIRASLEYRTGIVFNQGFAPERPDPSVMRAGGYGGASLPATSGALTVWFEIFAPRRGDRVAYALTGPDGQVLFEDSQMIDRDQARVYLFGGRRRPGDSWPVGRYLGRVTLHPGTPFSRLQNREFAVDLR